MPLSLALVLSLAGLASTQQAGSPLTLKPAVAQMVMVDAFVIDRKGKPIPGLTMEDFELLEDERRVTITAFRQPPGPDGTPAASPLVEMSERRLESAADLEPLTLVLYVDRRLLGPAGRRWALDQAFAIAEGHMARGARAVVIADENGLRPLTRLTTDPSAIRAALTRIQGWATSSPSVSDARSTLENVKSVIEGNAVANCDCVCSLPQTIQVVRGYAAVRDIEAREASDRLAFLVNSLIGVSGRKALIYVSEGLEDRPGIHLYDQLGQICPEARRREASAIFAAMQELGTAKTIQEVTARANAARVTLYPIDARGLTGLSSADISQADRAYVPSAGNDMIRDANLKAPLQRLAEDTGGFALLNGLDPKAAMKRFDAEAQGHYVVGFVPGDADGRIHQLRLRLSEKTRGGRNALVRHRESYLRAELPARRGQRALSALLFGLEENALDARIGVERMGGNTAQVRISVPLSILKPLAESPSGQTRIQVVIALRSLRGENRAVTVREKEVTLSLGEEGNSGDPARREITVDVPVSPDPYEFAIGVEDIASGRATYARLSLDPGSERAGEKQSRLFQRRPAFAFALGFEALGRALTFALTLI